MKLSIVIPAFNAGKHIEKCINSIVANNLDNYEIIVIDDASEDNTFQVCLDLSRRLSTLKIVRNEENIGQGLSRNRGIQLSTGDYIGFIDSDDYVDSHMYSDLLSLCSSSPDVVKCNLKKVRDLNAETPYLERLSNISNFESRNEIFNKVLLPLIGESFEDNVEFLTDPSACTGIYKRDLFTDLGIKFQSERVVNSEDFFFTVDVLRNANTFVGTSSMYYFYFMNEISTSHSFRSPIPFCEKLYSLSVELGPNAELRAKSGILNAVKIAIMQIAIDRSIPILSKISKIAELESSEIYLLAKDGYPFEKLDRINRIFYLFANRALGWPELLLASINQMLRSSHAL